MKLTNAYLQRLDTARKLLRCEAALKGLSEDDLLRSLDTLWRLEEVSVTCGEVSIYGAVKQSDLYRVIAFGPVGDTGYPAGRVDEYARQGRLDLWPENAKAGTHGGSYTFFLSLDVLWGLLQCRLEPIGWQAQRISVAELKATKPTVRVVARQEAGPSVEF